MNEEILKKLANRIRKLRKENKFTQEELSEKSGVSYKHIQKLEGNYMHDPKLDTLRKLAAAFNISVSEFLKFM
jgi:transcriptional regulator with XRE-family HTH domain